MSFSVKPAGSWIRPALQDPESLGGQEVNLLHEFGLVMHDGKIAWLNTLLGRVSKHELNPREEVISISSEIAREDWNRLWPDSDWEVIHQNSLRCKYSGITAEELEHFRDSLFFLNDTI